MFFICVGFFGLIATAIAQDPRHAAILTDARYLAGDGTFGAAYTQEDGVQFKEVSDANGDRRGSYSYVDPTGHRRTVEYTAGKNGFQPVGEGIPKVTIPTASPLRYESVAEYNPQEYQSQSKSRDQSEFQSLPSSYQYQAEQQYIRKSIYPPRSESPPQITFRPNYLNEYEVAEHKSRFMKFQTPRQHRILATQNSPQVLHQYQTKIHQSHQPNTQYDPTIEYSFDTPSESRYHQDRFEYSDVTSPSTSKIYSPGKLDFTRTPDGFSYVFIKS